MYQNLDHEDQSKDILQWWISHAHLFLTLSCVAREVSGYEDNLSKLGLMTRMRGTVNFFHWFSYIFGCSSANKSFIGIGVLLFPFYRGYLCISEILYQNFRLLLGLPQNIFLLIYFDMIVEISISCPLWYQYHICWYIKY